MQNPIIYHDNLPNGHLMGKVWETYNAQWDFGVFSDKPIRIVVQYHRIMHYLPLLAIIKHD